VRPPVVSIIIPCYRQAHFLPSAVRSALAQSLQDVEVVVVDDGSPDAPVMQLGDLAQDPRVLIVQQENRGLPMARNAGVCASHGEILNFLDADDWLAPEFCERLVPVLKSEEAPGFVYCDLCSVFENPDDASAAQKEYSVGLSRRLTSGNILPSLLLGGYFTPHTVLVPRRVLDSVGLFDPELGGHADWDLWLRIVAAGHLARYIDEKLAFYRLHGQSMSKDSAHMAETRSRTLHKLLRTSPDAVADSIYELQRVVEEAAGQGAWIRSLEEANSWHMQQARNWQTESEHWQTEAEHRQTEAAHRQTQIGHQKIEIEGLRTQIERLTAQLRRAPVALRWLLERYPLYLKDQR
jgi:GT2 family glycosyltransferase